MALTPLPIPPTRADPTNFSDRADAFLGALPLFQTEINALQSDVDAKQIAADNSADAALASQLAAAGSASAAAAVTGVTVWVSGTTYSAGDARYDPVDFNTYRRTTIGAGTTRPGLDAVNWIAITGDVTSTGTQIISGQKTFTAAVTTFSGDISVAGAAYTPPVQPSHVATPTFDASTGNVFEPAALTSNITSMTISNPIAGQTISIRFFQDATGGRTVALPTGSKVTGTLDTFPDRVSWLIMTYSARASRWEGNWMRVPV